MVQFSGGRRRKKKKKSSPPASHIHSSQTLDLWNASHMQGLENMSTTTCIRLTHIIHSIFNILPIYLSHAHTHTHTPRRLSFCEVLQQQQNEQTPKKWDVLLLDETSKQKKETNKKSKQRSENKATPSLMQFTHATQ